MVLAGFPFFSFWTPAMAWGLIKGWNCERGLKVSVIHTDSQTYRDLQTLTIFSTVLSKDYSHTLTNEVCVVPLNMWNFSNIHRDKEVNVGGSFIPSISRSFARHVWGWRVMWYWNHFETDLNYPKSILIIWKSCLKDWLWMTRGLLESVFECDKWL